MENLLPTEITQQVKDFFGKLQQPVAVLLFTSKSACEYCAEAQQLLQEVVELSPLLELRVHDIEDEADLAAHYRVSGKAPAIVITAKDGDQLTDYGIRFLGLPSGHEFGTLIQDLLIVSSRDSGLSAATREYLKSLKAPLHLQVFVTPTCPYCPRAVLLAHQFAMENPNHILAEGVESMEFSELANQYAISGVPDTVINNDAGRALGAVPEAQLLAEVRRALGQ